MKNEYSHFNPEKHEIKSKIAIVRRGHHYKFNINYHIIWIPKYRKKLLIGKVRDVLREIIQGQCYDLKIQMLALEVMPDHIHLFVGSTPTMPPYWIVKMLKGNTSIQLRRVFPELKYIWKNKVKKFKSLWASGYYIGSAGHVSQEQVRKYIEEQMGKPVFEYDIYECPEELKGQKKIGDFTK